MRTARHLFCAPAGCPSGATFTTVTNGYGLTGTFLWPSPTLGTHPVRFYSYNETKSTSTVVTVIHIGGIGEPQTDGVPNSRTNWSIAITNLIASSANATVVWVSVAGVSYDLYTSSQPLGGGASWGTPAITGLEAVANLSTAALPTAASGGMRFYQVVPQGQARTDRGVWGVVRPTIPSALFMMAPPLVGDRSFADDGALGRAFTSAVPVGSRIHFATNATPDWMTLELMAGGVWRTDPGIAEYATPLNPGQAFFIEGASATTPNFSGPVGNVNTQTLSLTVGANLVGLSEGKSLAASTAFSAASMNPDPVGNYNEDAADQLVIQHSDGSWRRLIRQPGGTWYDMETRTTTTVALNPGEAAYYIRRSNSSSVAF
jgi:hypothetical protein